MIVRGVFAAFIRHLPAAFAEYGYGPTDDFRIEPSYETLHGEVVLIVDRAGGWTALTRAEQAAVMKLVGPPRAEQASRSSSIAVTSAGPVGCGAAL